MVERQTISINLLHLVRIIAVALLILFFLPWIPSIDHTSSGVSLVLEAASGLNYIDVMPTRLLIAGCIIGLGFIPIGALLILFLAYIRRLYVPSLCILIGVIGVLPFIVTTQPPNDIRKWYFPMILTPLCLLALIVIGVLWHWKRTNIPNDRSGKLMTGD